MRVQSQFTFYIYTSLHVSEEKYEKTYETKSVYHNNLLNLNVLRSRERSIRFSIIQYVRRLKYFKMKMFLRKYV